MTKLDSHKHLGHTLLTLCEAATEEVILVAPFIKEAALSKLLSVISWEVPIRCVTRWHPHEISAGVCDLGIWSILKERSNHSLWLLQDLHAKFYRIDDKCLIGSANLTYSALGWKSPSNFELLLPFNAHDPEIQAFEYNLFANAVAVNEGIYRQVEKAVQNLPRNTLSVYSYDLSELILNDDDKGDLDISISRKLWLPLLRYPEDLYKAYSGELKRLSTGSRIAALIDLQRLMIPMGLEKDTFVAYVGAMLLQQPLIQKVDEFIDSPQRFGAVKGLLASQFKGDPSFDPAGAWQTLMRWLLHFLPNRYELTVPRYSEIISRKA